MYYFIEAYRQIGLFLKELKDLFTEGIPYYYENWKYACSNRQTEFQQKANTKRN